MVDKICVCGAGTMGAGIAQLAAQSGFETVLYDLDGAAALAAGKRIEGQLCGLVEKKRLTSAQAEAALGRLQLTGNIGDCRADVVIEAIAEQMEAKLSLFSRIAALNDAGTVLATNTSSLSVTNIAEHTLHPERVMGMHFFNPAPLMKLIELVSTSYTSPETISVLHSLARAFGKTSVLCRDAPGFIVNHVARPFYLEALRLLETGLTDIETIDSLLEASGFRMGPFRLMDLIGHDINYAVSCSVYEGLGKPERLMPSPLQQLRVTRGELGKKSGRGFYSYP